MAPGETIIDEFVVNLRPPLERSVFLYYLLCLCTFGLYYIFIQCCACIRSKTISVRRGRMILTSHGRIGVWYTDTKGSQSANVLCCRGRRKVNSSTKISWFKVADVSHMQHYHSVQKITRFFCISRTEWTSSLRIFFGVYPDQAICDAYNTGFAVPKCISMFASLSPTDIASYYSVVGYFQRIGTGVAKALKQGLANTGLIVTDDSTMLEISTSNLDIDHELPNKVYKDIYDIQRRILEMKKLMAILPADRVTKNFRVVQEHQKLVQDDIAYLNVMSIPLKHDEHFIDAYTFSAGWTFKEVFLTIFTAGLYWIWFARARHALTSAMVISNYRLFEISQDFKPGCCSDGENFTYVIRSWFLNGMDTGIMSRERLSIWAEVQTGFGAIKIAPHINAGWFDRVFCGLSRQVVTRTKNFLLQFSQSVQFKPVLAASRHMVAVPPMVTEEFVLAPYECVVGHRHGENTAIGYKICGIQVPDILSYPLTCGKFPIRAVQEYVVTSHRLLAVSHADNNACCKSFMSLDYSFYFWSALSSSYLLGYQVKGDVNDNESICVSCLPCCGRTVQSSVAISLNYAFSTSQTGKPVSVLTIQKSATSGLMNDPVISAIRFVLGSSQASSAALGFDRYAPSNIPTQPMPIEFNPAYAPPYSMKTAPY